MDWDNVIRQGIKLSNKTNEPLVFRPPNPCDCPQEYRAICGACTKRDECKRRRGNV
jgi:hypothetical protein